MTSHDQPAVGDLLARALVRLQSPLLALDLPSELSWSPVLPAH